MVISVVEDDALVIEDITASLKKCLLKIGLHDQFDILTFSSGEEFQGKYVPGYFNLILLDIFLDDMSGIDIARFVRSHNDSATIAFITNSNDYASQSYEVKASYYLQKPISEADILRMLSAINFSFIEKARFIVLPDNTNLFLSEIMYTDRLKHNVWFYLSSNKDKTARLTQKEVAEMLLPNPEFISVGQGTIVNLSYVKELTGSSLILSNGTVIHIPKRNYKSVKNSYARYCFESSIKEISR